MGEEVTEAVEVVLEEIDFLADPLWLIVTDAEGEELFSAELLAERDADAVSLVVALGESVLDEVELKGLTVPNVLVVVDGEPEEVLEFRALHEGSADDE